MQVVLNDLLNSLKMSSHLQIMFTKLSRESCIWGQQKLRRLKRIRGNIRNDKRGLRSKSTLPRTHPLEESVVDVN